MNKELLNEMRSIVNKYDPIRIYLENNFDEYDLEIKDIYSRFKKM